MRRQLEREAPDRLVPKRWLYSWLTYSAIAAMIVVILAMALVDEVRAQLWWRLGSLAVVLDASWWRYRRAGAGEWAGRTSSARA